MTIDGVEITSDLPDLSETEARRYVEYVKKRVEGKITAINVTASADGKVDLNWTAQGERFERVRRVTGYLTGDLRSWNDAKQAEERERVKHYGFLQDMRQGI